MVSIQVLFAAVQGAYVLLNDDAKRKSYDLRVERREQQADRLRKRKERDEELRRNGQAPSMRHSPSTNSFHIPPQCTADAKQREFNRKFYNEYRNATMNNRRPPPPPGPAPCSSASNSKPAATNSTSGVENASKRERSASLSPPPQPVSSPFLFHADSYYVAICRLDSG